MKRKKKSVVAKDYSGEYIRIQKIIAQAGIASRREAEELIKNGRISLNGEKITDLGVKANPKIDEVSFDGVPVHFQPKEYYLFYKPDGFITARPKSIDEINQTIWAILPNNNTLFAAGRLDKQSEGLLIITNDGEFANIMTHPRYKIEKVYEIIVRGKLSYPKLKMLEEGIWLSDGKMRIHNIKVKKRTTESSVIEIKIKNSPTEHIRTVFQKIGHPISKIVRTQIGPWMLKGIKHNEFKKIKIEDVQVFIKSIAKTPQKRTSEKSKIRQHSKPKKSVTPQKNKPTFNKKPKKNKDEEFIG